MKSNKLNYIIVSAFVLIVLAGALVSVTFLTGRRGDEVSYFAVYDNVTGIKYGTRVLYEGYRIGQVKTVDPFESHGQMRFRIVMSIRKDWRIPNDSVARMEAPTLLSPIVINIAAGDSETPFKPDEKIVSEEASNIFAALSSVAGQVAELSESIKPVLKTVDRTVGEFGDILENDGAALVSGLRTATEQLTQRLPAILEDLRQTSGEVRSLVVDDRGDGVQAMLDNINSAVADLGSVSKDLRDTLAYVDALVVNLDGLVVDNGDNVQAILKDMRYTSASLARHVDTISQNLEGASRNAFELSRRLRRDPGLILRGGPEEELEAETDDESRRAGQ